MKDGYKILSRLVLVRVGVVENYVLKSIMWWLSFSLYMNYWLLNKSYSDIFLSQSNIFLKFLHCDEVLKTMLVSDKEKIYHIVFKHVRNQMIRHYRTMTFIEWKSLCVIRVGCPLNQGVWWHWYGIQIRCKDTLSLNKWLTCWAFCCQELLVKYMSINILQTWDHHSDLQATHCALVPNYLNF